MVFHPIAGLRYTPAPDEEKRGNTMVDSRQSTPSVLPSVERIQQELARSTSIDDFFGKEGIFARLFADTLEQMLEAELTAHLGYPRHAPEGHNSGNSRNGKRTRQLRTSTGDTTIQVPRDRNSTFQSPLLDAYQTSTNELEEKIIGLYAKACRRAIFRIRCTRRMGSR